MGAFVTNDIVSEIQRLEARGEGHEDIYVALLKRGTPVNKSMLKNYILRRSAYSRRYGS